jgi:hypothetical protein
MEALESLLTRHLDKGISRALACPRATNRDIAHQEPRAPAQDGNVVGMGIQHPDGSL